MRELAEGGRPKQPTATLIRRPKKKRAEFEGAEFKEAEAVGICTMPGRRQLHTWESSGYFSGPGQDQGARWGREAVYLERSFRLSSQELVYISGKA